ncbi:F-box/kelch-repeat protein [Citrus sinensis]|nr:F-box/kelch-repeat protein [Citrus sinensis]
MPISKTMSDIPYDIAVEVLSRLPVKSLLRFKSVCKQWFSLISDPKFAVLQYKHSAKNSPLKILTSNYYISPYSTLWSLDCSTKSLDDPRALRALNFPFATQDTSKIIGSCNGLICLALGKRCADIFIWNPSTGAYRKLPDHNFPLYFKLEYDRDNSYRGFGYDSSTNDYKVIFYVPDTDSYSSSSIDEQAYVFSSKNNSWRRVKHKFRQYSEDHICKYRSIGSLLNETLHWLTKWGSAEDFGSVITAFDLAEEKFREVPTPDLVDDVRGEMCVVSGLGVVDGHLCLVRWISDLNGTQGQGGDLSVGLWMMKECGVKSSWEKLYHIGNSNELCGDIVPQCRAGCDEDEVIILTQVYGDNFVRYYPKKETKVIENLGDFVGTVEAVAYVESLISPHVCIPM